MILGTAERARGAKVRPGDAMLEFAVWGSGAVVVGREWVARNDNRPPGREVAEKPECLPAGASPGGQGMGHSGGQASVVDGERWWQDGRSVGLRRLRKQSTPRA